MLTGFRQDVAVRGIYNDGEYKKHNSTWHAEDSPWKAAQVDEIISRNRLDISTICEVGCGAGEILRQLSLKGRYRDVAFTGYEVSTDAFSLCKQRESENISFVLSDILEDDVFFDMMLCIDVFEHVDNYMGFLARLRDKAKYKIFHIPLDLSVNALLRNTLVAARESLGHLHYFSPDTAIATLRDCGYETVDVMYTPSFSGLPPKSSRARLVKYPRQMLYAMSPRLMSTLLGGCSLMVLAK